MLDTYRAKQIAQERGFDLVEVADKTNPPVCRLMDYGKFQYQQSKSDRKQKAQIKKTYTKGIRLRLGTGMHDLDFKSKQAMKFLHEGHRVQIEIILRGREKSLGRLAVQTIENFIEKLNNIIIIQKDEKRRIKIEQPVKRSGRGFIIIVCLK